ncbi:acetyl-lysine deacetylase [Pyrococcus furiosus DSM 3638]|uniref:Putative [LysW]-lysine/[LysW]-ornithine hydrolase n=3 Tax=Pyrococcus furiosus TaxID=2261 RepID=LYSK_PYRFU|nr:MULTISPECIES: [LysW]-lysine hydrolase [Pyrococcus]Q8U0B3.1 RecName: Full=Putative [LysW]-lysine/[LysW]-ornithine hydrolase [Pyrococcus furiosus DSM 3638]AAL81810.1 acetylornithine deacetylase [Pyrococcus furiosus DSM 3638]AFN04954.1 acetyl-lysine deacetylase [Pyrococcus furiosus COM1]MDK2870178.1 [amino group carrier protein]-lysine/ornithine hydrolase [Pyrococcus sp.]QEK79304.1 acetyl-lysine deacetylase [Pyrococcus furiosus DSM 3638]
MISTEEKIEFLKRLVEIYSPTGKENGVAKFLIKSFENYGIEAYLDDVGNVIAVKKGKGPLILLAGHMDTVPGYIPVRIENGELWGRGAVDAKGPLATFFFATIESDANIIFAGLVDEEGFSKGAKNLEVPKPDYIIVGEPSGTNGVTIGYKGSLTVKFTETVEKVHGSIGVGAAEKLIEKWLTIAKYFGEGFNSLSGRIVKFVAYEREFDFFGEMIVNLRTPPGYMPPKEWDIIDFVPAYEVSRTSPLVRAFVRAIRKAGYKPKLKKKTGTADTNILGPKYGVDAIAYGPGDSKLDHTPYERIKLREYLEAIEILKNAILELSSND